MQNKKVSIYSTPSCHYCQGAKAFFVENGIAFENFDVSVDLAKRQEMVDMTGQMGVPVIVVGDDAMVGFNEPKLREFLGM